MHVRALDLMCVSYRINREFLPMSKNYRNLFARFEYRHKKSDSTQTWSAVFHLF